MLTDSTKETVLHVLGLSLDVLESDGDHESREFYGAVRARFRNDMHTEEDVAEALEALYEAQGVVEEYDVQAAIDELENPDRV
jgi:hypothetical protein